MVEEPLLRFGDTFTMRHSHPLDAMSIIAEGLRHEDVDEWAKSAEGGVGNLEASIKTAQECYTILDSTGTPHIIFGVHDAIIPMTWLLGTPRGQTACYWILGQARGFYEEFFQRWPHTQCYSAPENWVHHRWLRWMGYECTGARSWGSFGHTFYEFTRDMRNG